MSAVNQSNSLDIMMQDVFCVSHPQELKSTLSSRSISFRISLSEKSSTYKSSDSKNKNHLQEDEPNIMSAITRPSILAQEQDEQHCPSSTVPGSIFSSQLPSSPGGTSTTSSTVPSSSPSTPCTPLPPLLEQACDVEQFRTSAHRLVDQIAEHYARCQKADAGYLNFPTVSARGPPAHKKEGEDDLQQEGRPTSLQDAASDQTVHDQDATNFRSYRRTVSLLEDHAPRENKQQTLSNLFDFVLSNTLHNHHPHNMAHQVAPAYPTTVLADFLAFALGNSQAVSELAPVNGAIERVCVEFALKKAFGFDSRAGAGGTIGTTEEGKGSSVVPDGVMVTGGSMGNLTALLVARERWKRRVFEEHGSSSAEEVVPLVFVSAQTHYCVERACRIMGFTDAQVVKVPCCPVSFGVSVQELEAKFKEYGVLDTSTSAERQHDLHSAQPHTVPRFSVMAVVLSAGSTSTGAFDDLSSVSAFLDDNFAPEKRPFVHVDGAHGGAVCFLSNDRRFSDPIRRCADSVVIDTHKLLGTSSNATFALFRDASDLRGCFQQEAVYLLNRAAGGNEDAPEHEESLQTAFRLWESDSVKNTIECTKPNISLRFFSLLHLFGEQFFDQHLRHLFGICALFCSLIGDDKYTAAGFELVGKPRGGYLDTMESIASGTSGTPISEAVETTLRCYTNIVCFRLVRFGANNEQNNALNKTIRQRLLAGGQFYISQTTLGDVVCLRCTFMVPHTDERALRALLDEIARIGAEVEAEMM